MLHVCITCLLYCLKKTQLLYDSNKQNCLLIKSILQGVMQRAACGRRPVGSGSDSRSAIDCSCLKVPSGKTKWKPV